MGEVADTDVLAKGQGVVAAAHADNNRAVQRGRKRNHALLTQRLRQVSGDRVALIGSAQGFDRGLHGLPVGIL